MRIYTKTGDKGQTSLYDGTKVFKDNIILDCIGDIDELNSNIGLIMSNLNLNSLFKTDENVLILEEIQNELFDLGTLIAYPNDPSKKNIVFDNGGLFAKKLEMLIDNMTAKLPKLKNFILPSGSINMSVIHVARSVCRRAERKLVSLKTHDIIVLDECLIYINRMSDYLFTLARYVGFVENVPEIIYNSKRNK